MPKPIRPTSFEWRLQSESSLRTGQQKAAMVDRMEEIAQRIARGRASLEFSYDKEAVIAKVSAKTSPEMVERSAAKAAEHTSKGFKGLLSRFLLFRHGLGEEARQKLQTLLARQYLLEEQDRATNQLMAEFQAIMALAGSSLTPAEAARAESSVSKPPR